MSDKSPLHPTVSEVPLKDTVVKEMFWQENKGKQSACCTVSQQEHKRSSLYTTSANIKWKASKVCFRLTDVKWRPTLNQSQNVMQDVHVMTLKLNLCFYITLQQVYPTQTTGKKCI